MAAFPAPAGINRIRRLERSITISVPRTRGDKPFSVPSMLPLLARSPHPRG